MAVMISVRTFALIMTFLLPVSFIAGFVWGYLLWR